MGASNTIPANTINANTGVIDTSKLVKGGKLLIKITRKVKDGWPAVVEYVNFAVDKQTASDLSGFTTTANGIVWGSGVAVTYNKNSAPAGETFTTTTYTKEDDGTTAGSSGASAGVTVASSGGAITAKRGGVVKVTVTYSNDKYNIVHNNVNVAMAKQDKPNSIAISASNQEWGK